MSQPSLDDHKLRFKVVFDLIEGPGPVLGLVLDLTLRGCDQVPEYGQVWLSFLLLDRLYQIFLIDTLLSHLQLIVLKLLDLQLRLLIEPVVLLVDLVQKIVLLGNHLLSLVALLKNLSPN